MKIQTNAGEVELTAEMVCRGMVFDSRLWLSHPCTLESLDGLNRDGEPAWIVREGGGVFPLTAERFLGCDPAIATRAACERYGVHGDAGAHGFARLRDGGAVDLLRTLPRGATYRTESGTRFLRNGDGGDGMLPDCIFVGLDAEFASPEDVRRLCCGERQGGYGALLNVRCSLAIGDHAGHEDLATGVKWSAGAERYLSDAKPRADFNANLRAAAAIAEPREGTAEDIQRRVAETFAAPAVAGWKVAQESVTKFAQALGACPNCGGDDATCRGSLAGLKACAAKGAQMADHALSDADIVAMVREDGYEVAVKRDFGGALRVTVYGAPAAYCRSLSARIQDRIPSDIMLSVESGWGGVEVASGKALDHLAALYDEKRRTGETCEDLRARLCRVHARGPRKDTGNGFRVGGPYVVGVDPAQPETDSTVHGPHPSAAGLSDSAKECLYPGYRAAMAFCAFIAGLKRWAESPEGRRAQREAPLVALVAAVPAGLDPIGWRAAVLAGCEIMTPEDWKDDGTGTWLREHALDAAPPEKHSASLKMIAWKAYRRASAPAPKVDRVRATWKTRGPVLPCDNGEDE